MIQWKKVSQDKETDPTKIPTEVIIAIPNKIGIDMGRYREGTRLDPKSFLILYEIVDKRKMAGDTLDNIVGDVVCYIRGYCEGIEFANKIREGDR
jgi:hypothetical protein